MPLLALSMMLYTDALGQLVTYDFEGDTAVASQSDSGVNPTSFTINDSRSVTFPTGNGGDVISATGWTGVEGAKFWEFSITASTGIEFDLAELSFDYRSTGSGPTSWSVFINGGEAGSGTIDNDLDYHPVSLSLSGFSGINSAHVQLNAFGTTSGGGRFSLDDVSLDGLALMPVPEPSTWLLLSGGLAFLATRFRRRK